jgi:nucleotide-binding universal stress UspA family protein
MFKTIVWATDGSPAADNALPYALALARADCAELVVVHDREILATIRAGATPLHADEDELAAKIKAQVLELREEGLGVSLKLAAGTTNPAQPIAEVAQEVGADVIVVGTRGHTALAGLLLGSVTQRLLHIAPCPVLAVPPDPGA